MNDVRYSTLNPDKQKDKNLKIKITKIMINLNCTLVREFSQKLWKFKLNYFLEDIFNIVFYRITSTPYLMSYYNKLKQINNF